MRYWMFASVGFIALAAGGSATAQFGFDDLGDYQSAAAVDAPVRVAQLPQHQSGCDHYPGYAGIGSMGGPHGYAPLMPYEQPTLPPSSTFYGYFNSPPEYAHLWATYPQEVAIRAAAIRHTTAPHHVGSKHHSSGGWLRKRAAPSDCCPPLR